MAELSNMDIESFAGTIIGVDDLTLDIFGQQIVFKKSNVFSINNQDGTLQEENFLGRHMEFEFELDDKTYYIALQLYFNESGFYRLFVFDQNGKMWTSVNLSTGYENGIVNFDIQIKVSSPQTLSKEERAEIRDNIVGYLREQGLQADKKNHISFGAYNVEEKCFINTTPKKFISDLLTIALCKRFTNKLG